MPARFRVDEQSFPHFITSTFVHWIPVLCRDDYFKVIADGLRYCVEQKGLLVHGYTLMPNHVHALVTHPGGILSATIRDFKRHTSGVLARKLEVDKRDLWLRAFQRAAGPNAAVRIWMDGFHPEEVRTEPFFTQKMLYMLDNPVRAGYVDSALSWKYSSARDWFLDEPGVVPLTGLDW